MKFRPFTVWVLMASLVLTVPASAHAHLESSIPASNAQLAEAPAILTLRFSEPAQLTLLTLTTAGHAVPVTLNRDAKAGAEVVVPLPALKPGSYQVQWRVIAADDGHVTHGKFSFTVGGA